MNTVFLAILFYLHDGNITMSLTEDMTQSECLKEKKISESRVNQSGFVKVDFICTDKKGLIKELDK